MSWETISESKPKARKDYRCMFCGNTIEKGKTYRKSVGKWEGELIEWKYCEFCDSFLINAYMDATGECEWTTDDGREFIQEYGRKPCAVCGELMTIDDYDISKDEIIHICEYECSEYDKPIKSPLKETISNEIERIKEWARKHHWN